MWPFRDSGWLNIEEDTLSEIGSQMPQFLLYEAAGRKKRACQCTACGNRGVVEVKGKTGDRVLCPFCMEPVELKCHTRLKDNAPSLERWINGVYFVNRGGTLWAVGCRIYRRLCRNGYDGPDWYIDMDVVPFEVWRFDTTCGAAMEWKQEFGLGGALSGCGWYGPQRPREPQTNGILGGSSYYLWQTDKIDETSMKYCRAGELVVFHEEIRDGNEVGGLIRYLTAYCQRPKLELVCKWGLQDVAEDWVWRRKTNGRYVNWEANTPWAFLNISKADWGAYRKTAGASVELLVANRRVFKLPVQEVLRIAAQLGRPDWWIEKATAITHRGIDLKAQLKYLNRQTGRAMSLVDKLRYWKDYLDMAERAGRDMRQKGAWMPRDLFAAHDEMVEFLRLQAQEEGERREAEALRENLLKMDQARMGYQKRREGLQRKYGYQSRGLMIKVPEGGEEIIREGNVLHICVGGYAARHLTGQTTILFLRRERKPDTPYVCIEISEKDNSIRQIHGYRNEWLGNGKRGQDPGEKFKPFLDEWLAWVKAGSKRGVKKQRKDGIA